MRRKAAVVAVIKSSKHQVGFAVRTFKQQVDTDIKSAKSPLPSSKQVNSLAALTSAALVLPGLFAPLAQAAEGDEVDFQYGHYQESKRSIKVIELNNSSVGEGITGKKSTNPIEVDSIHGSARISLTDRIKFAFNYVQDTWGGATPISTAPGFLGLNDARATTVGASPYVQSSPRTGYVDRKGRFYDQNDETGNLFRSKGLTHVLSTASPETRKQGDFKLTYELDEAAISVGGGISVEDDYESRFGNIGARWDLNQKQTTLNLDLSYTNSDTNALLDHDLVTYIEKDRYYFDNVQTTLSDTGEPQYASNGTFQGNRQDWSTHFGVTQVLNKDALISGDFTYIRSTGYMANPYKLTQVFFANPDFFGDFGVGQDVAPIKTTAFLERRPDTRNQWQVGGRFVQYISPLDAAFHFDYRFSGDDWGINAHTFEADWVQPLGSGWSVTPRIRYYSQDAADFYHPFLVVFDKKQSEPINVNGSTQDANLNKLPAAFSSDQRLSGYGALSGGVTVAKQFAKGITLETGFEYYTHQGGLKLGGQGERSYADFDYWLANAALKVDLNVIGSAISGSQHTGHEHHHHGVHAPAGVMFDHMLPKAGDFMVGYRYLWNSQGGPMLHGSDRAADSAIVANGCGGDQCYLSPDNMSMHMHMLDLMYAPTDWLTLMLMPQFMDMDMTLRQLDGSPQGGLPDKVSGHLTHHTENNHQTGGFGDLGMYALFKLFDDGMHHFHVTAGLSAPTGDVDLQFRRNHQVDGGFQHYGMQLGSGTWDFKPSITYTGRLDVWSWGAQANGILRMESKNESGYRLGDLFQATAWGSYDLTHWLTASIRGVYTNQDRIIGRYYGALNQFTDPNATPDPSTGETYGSIFKFGPMDYPKNYGGQYWDIGFGLSAVVPSGDLAGNRVSVEWLQPVEDDVNGYQQERDGALSATWSVAF